MSTDINVDEIINGMVVDLKARAIENQAFVLGVNRIGIGDGLEYTGDSILLHPMGEEL